MSEYRLGEIETQFADLIWDNEPLSSGDLVKLAAEKLSWKKSTTYTILRRLCEKGIFQNQDGVVTSLISKEELQSAQSEKFVEDTFAGSLPQFLTAFARRKKLSKQEIDEIQRFIDENRG
ncbi:MAG: BlaI/MecI/CopY family transcriptional regulator [Lachnospiraceae bacterium]|nr:BlaI/MecI/CopY family transcriptional regulator [Lachnospiraceae bacterium]